MNERVRDIEGSIDECVIIILFLFDSSLQLRQSYDEYQENPVDETDYYAEYPTQESAKTTYSDPTNIDWGDEDNAAASAAAAAAAEQPVESQSCGKRKWTDNCEQSRALPSVVIYPRLYTTVLFDR